MKNKNVKAISSSLCKRAYDTIKDLALTINPEIKIVDDFRDRETGNVWFDDLKPLQRNNGKTLTTGRIAEKILGKYKKETLLPLMKYLKNVGSNIVIGSHGTVFSTVINYYNPDFGYEGFLSIVDKMPYILCFKFNKKEVCQHGRD